MANCRVQFEEINLQECVSPLDYETDCFVPEMSLPVKDILAQFAFVDGVRLQDLMKQGYVGTDDDSIFDLPDFDSLDIAEKQEYYEKSKRFVEEYENSLKSQESQEPEPPFE